MNDKAGCLIIHGFAGCVKEVWPIAEYLSERGYQTLCAELKGHNENRQDLARSNYKEWIKSAEDSYLSLQQKCGKVVVIGFSMGGLIAVNLLQKHDICKLVLINTPVRFWDVKRIAINLLGDIKNRNCGNVGRYIGACVDKPLKSLINFLILLNKTKRMFREINCPVLVGQGKMDDTVQYRSADYIFEKVVSMKRIKYYENSGHMIFQDKEKEEVFRDIEEFIMQEIH